MRVEHTKLSGVVLIVPKKFGDNRGYFSETYTKKAFVEAGVDVEFIQDNQSLSAKVGTVRGLHFQNPPEPQSKLVRVLQGAIFDVAVDLRRGSPTYGQWVGYELTAEVGEQLFVPRGFAHAFCTLTPDTIVSYKVDGYYAPSCDAGLFWADETIGIAWPIKKEEAVLSEKDAKLPAFKDFDTPFTYGR